MSNNDSFYLSMLYDFYKDLLTDKQKKYFEEYYFMDFSLSEIAENYQVSRNAVFDQLNNTVKILENYEEKLKLYHAYLVRKDLIAKIKELSDDSEVLDLLAKLEGVE